MQTHDFQNPQISIQQLPDYLNVQLQPLDRRYLYIIIINYLILSLIFGFLLIFLFAGIRQRVDISGFYPFVALFIIPFLLSFISNILRYMRRGYALRNHDWIYQAGIFATSTTIIPFNKVQHVALKEGWLSRTFDLASIELYTAGSSGSDLKVNGIPKNEALRIRDFIAEKIQHNPSQNVIQQIGIKGTDRPAATEMQKTEMENAKPEVSSNDTHSNAAHES